MTMRRVYRRHGRRQLLTASVREFLETGRVAPDAALDEYLLARGGDALQSAWRTHRSEILPEWIREYPGTRPFGWWQVDAPEPSRRRLGGTGTPAHEVLAYAAGFVFGLPSHWITPFLAAYYRGEAREIDGQTIGVEYRGASFGGVAIDPRDPPSFESQASYLKRHHLLTPEERTRLGPADFEAERVTQEEDNDAER